MSDERPLHDKRILVVEDEFLVALDLSDIVERLGAAEVRTAGTLGEALAAADERFDGAFVDVQLRDEKSFPVIEKLRAAGVPLILTTGYDPGTLPAHVGDLPRIAKPFAPTELRRAVEDAFGR